MVKCVSTKKNLLMILKSKIFQDKKVLVYSKPFMKVIGILLFIVRFVKSSGQTIIRIIRKNESVLMILVNPINCFTGTYLKPLQHLR